MFGSILNNYGSYLMPIHHSDFYTYQFSPVAHNFPSLALYPHGSIEAFLLAVPYAKYFLYIRFLSDSYQIYIGATSDWNIDM